MTRSSLLTVLLLLLVPATAQAAGTVALDGDRLVITGSPGADAMAVALRTDSPDLVVEQVGLDGTKGPTEPGNGCRRESRYGDVPKIFCPAAGVTQVSIDLGDGDDIANVQVQLPTPVELGAGDDQLYAYGSTLTGVLGDGDDEADVSAKGTTTISGGAGDDDIDCHDGLHANDSKGARRYDGGAGRDRLCGGRDDDELEGGAGNDKVYGGEGEDKLDGGSGDDILKGDDENDTIVGGAGEDEIDAGSGSDTIRARDRQRDDVSCGAKRDRGDADKRDALVSCEAVRRR